MIYLYSIPFWLEIFFFTWKIEYNFSFLHREKILCLKKEMKSQTIFTETIQYYAIMNKVYMVSFLNIKNKWGFTRSKTNPANGDLMWKCQKIILKIPPLKTPLLNYTKNNLLTDLKIPFFFTQIFRRRRYHDLQC